MLISRIVLHLTTAQDVLTVQLEYFDHSAGQKLE